MIFLNFSFIGLYLPSFHRHSMHLYWDTKWTNASLFFCLHIPGNFCLFIYTLFYVILYIDIREEIGWALTS